MNYCEISLAEMVDLLKSEKGWKIVDFTNVREYVFEYKLQTTPGVVVRVYSSIRRDTNCSRSCGRDAIRVCAVDVKRNRGLVRSIRVLRIGTWRYNLKKRVLSVLEIAKTRASWNYNKNTDKSARKA